MSAKRVRTARKTKTQRSVEKAFAERLQAARASGDTIAVGIPSPLAREAELEASHDEAIPPSETDDSADARLTQ